jgi:mono/diheme cytochrome c family protein
MKAIVKWVLIPVGTLATLIASGAGYLFAAFPKAEEPSATKVKSTPELVQRGEYLANHVTVCVDCHAERDWSRFSGPPKPGTLGHGGEHFTREMGLPGDFYSKNITPGGVGNWSDGELIRAITTGVTRDGRAMFPIMPYNYFRHLCERDLHAIIAYVRSLPSTNKTHPETELDFPVSLIVRTMPQAAEPWSCPTPGSAEYGKYLVTIAGCPECHTKQDKGKIIGERLAGGWRFPLPTGGHITSKNITPDPETGIGKWTKEQFVATFQSRGKPDGAFPVKPGERQSLMPWNMYGGMSAEDLGAIYDYLRTVTPVKNVVPEFEPPAG